MPRPCAPCFLAALLFACTADNIDFNGGLGDGDAAMPGEDGPAPDLASACVAEICGDAKDNNCDGNADEGCGGLGTFVSGATGDDQSPGTQAQPVATIAQGMAHAAKIGGQVDVYVAAGHYPEKIRLVDGVGLLGGHACSRAACTWARDAKSVDVAHDTALLAPDAEGVLADKTVTRRTRVDGFRIVGRGAAGATIAVTLDGGTPIISNNRIVGGAATGNGAVSVAVRVYGAAAAQGALIEGNEISGGTSTETTHGVLIQGRPGQVTAPFVTVLRGNRIVGGSGRSTFALTSWASGAGTLVQGNDLVGGASVNGSSWAINTGAPLLIDGNRVNVAASGAGCEAPSGWCGGVLSTSSSATLTNNVIFGASSPRSAAVLLQEVETAAGVVVLNGNYLDGAGVSTSDGALSAAVVTRIGQCLTCGFRGVMGRVRNNILAGGKGRQRYGVYEDSVASRTNRPEALENNFFVSMPNVGRIDVLYRSWDGVKGTDYTTLGPVNQLARPPASGNKSGDPLVDATFHLRAGSPCIGAGTATEAPARDLDDQMRPQGGAFDIGVDEVP